MTDFEQTTTHNIEALVQIYYRDVRRICLSILGNPAEANDAAQETFFSAQRNLSGFRNEASPRTWLTAIAINTCRGILRKRKRQQALQHVLQGLHLVAEWASETSQPTAPESLTIQRQANQQLWGAVDNLDEKQRLPLILYYVHELSVAEIARVIGVKPGTVHSRLHYARQTILAELQESPGESGETHETHSR